jgi:hypothetical protein
MRPLNYVPVTIRNERITTPLDAQPPFTTHIEIGDYVILQIRRADWNEYRARIGRIYLVDDEDVVLGIEDTNPPLAFMFIRVPRAWVKLSLRQQRSYQSLRTPFSRAIPTAVDGVSGSGLSVFSRVLRRCRSALLFGRGN